MSSASATGKKKRVRFELKGKPGSTVFLAGSFNNWSPTENPMKYTKGAYSTSLLLPPGTCQYKFVVDGVWSVDPQCTDWTTNDFGTLNSIIEVQ